MAKFILYSETLLVSSDHIFKQLLYFLIVNKRVQNAVLGCNLKNDRMTSVHFQGKPLNFMVIQVCDPTTNSEKAEVEWFYEDLHDLLELTPNKMSFS